MRYVGYSSLGIEKRWLKHVALAFKGVITLFSCAIREFGNEAFDHDVICTVETEKEAKILERHFIEMLNTWGPLGYNMTRGGNGNGGALRGRKYSSEHRHRISEAHKGKVLSLETRRKLSEIGSQRVGEDHPMRGKHFSDEARINMSNAKKELYATERGLEIRQRTSQTMIGGKLTEEHKRNLSKAGLGHKHSDETRRKLSEAAKRREAKWRNVNG